MWWACRHDTAMSGVTGHAGGGEMGRLHHGPRRGPVVRWLRASGSRRHETRETSCRSSRPSRLWPHARPIRMPPLCCRSSRSEPRAFPATSGIPVDSRVSRTIPGGHLPPSISALRSWKMLLHAGSTASAAERPPPSHPRRVRPVPVRTRGQGRRHGSERDRRRSCRPRRLPVGSSPRILSFRHQPHWSG